MLSDTINTAKREGLLLEKLCKRTPSHLPLNSKPKQFDQKKIKLSFYMCKKLRYPIFKILNVLVISGIVLKICSAGKKIFAMLTLVTLCVTI